MIEVLDRVDALVAECDPAEVPLVVGRLEAAKHRALSRLSPAAAPARQPDDDEMLTMPEVARILQRSEDTVRRWGREGVIPTVPVGRRGVGVRRGSLRDLIRRRERPTIHAR